MMTRHYARTLLVTFAMISGIALTASGIARANDDGFLDTRIALGMDFASALKIYPAAKIGTSAAVCYSYGSVLDDPAMARRTLRYRDKIFKLELSFASPSKGGRLVRIDYDRRVKPTTFDFSPLIEQLTRRYGAHDRILHRRKMEPAGRIIGFEWRTTDRTSLRVVLHDDFRSTDDRFRLSFLARSEEVLTKRSRCTSLRCFPCIRP